MKVLANKQVYEKKGDLDKLLEENARTFELIKQNLKDLNNDLKNSERTHLKEPETRVKRIVHHTLATKFKEVLKTSQVIQRGFKNDVQSQIKQQIIIAKPDVTEEEMELYTQDADAAQKVLDE